MRWTVRMRSSPSSTSAWLKLIPTCGAISLSAKLTVASPRPAKISYSGSGSTVNVRVLSGMSRQSSGGVTVIDAVTSPGANAMLEGMVTASPGKLPVRNPPGSLRETPAINSPAVLVPRVKVKVTGEPSVMLVSLASTLMVGWSSSRISPLAVPREWSSASIGRSSALMSSESS